MADAPPLAGPTAPGRVAAESLKNLGLGWPDFSNVDLGEELLVVGAVVAFLLILVPVLFSVSS